MSYLAKILTTLAVAMVPIIELRGAIPVGLGTGLTYLESFIAAYIGNMLPVPFIILFSRQVFAWLRRFFPKLDSLISRFEARTERKAEIFHKYQILGLIILVAIPLPGTGAWTGSAVAALLRIRLKHAVPAIAVGVLIAGIIVTFISYSAITIFG